MGGSDDDSNIVELSIPEHAEAHRILYETYGKLEDKYAWLALSNKKEEAEKARIELVKQRLLGQPKSAIQRQRMSDTHKRNPVCGHAGKHHSVEWRKAHSERMREYWKERIHFAKLNVGKRKFVSETGEIKMMFPKDAPEGWIRSPRSKK